MSTMRYVAVAVAIMLVLSITYYAYYRANATNNAIGIDGKLYIYKNGKLVHSGADLLTDNFYNYIIALLEENFHSSSAGCTNAPSSVFSYTPTIKGTSDVSGSTAGYCYSIYSSATTNNVYIGLGTSNGAPTRSDINLITKLATVVATSTYVSSNPAYVNYTASYTASSAVTIGEVSLYWFYTTVTSTSYTMVAHDSVSISMQAGDVIAITYQLKDATSSNSKFFALLYQCSARALPSTNAYQSGSTNLCINGGGTMSGCPISYVATSTGSSTTCNNVQISYANGKATFLGTTANTISSVNQLQYFIYIGATFFIPITLSFSSVNLVQGQLAGFQISGG